MTSNFRTEIKLKKNYYPEVSYSSKLFLIGSCFSNQIGERFKQHKFNTLINPLGITYNPISISSQIKRFATNNPLQVDDLISKEDLFNSYDLHGSFDNLKSNELIDLVNDKIEQAHQFLKNASHIYITLGTSWVYVLKESNEVVNNCHKKPANFFEKILLSTHEVYKSLEQIKHCLFDLNPGAKIIFTVSPVRHLKDGIENNNLSKSILRIALNEVFDKHTFYFPAFEIIMDDLRDYRFYEDDLLHPNNQAVNYIWMCLIDSQMTDSTLSLLKKINALMLQFNHRTFVDKSKASKEARNSLITKLKALQNEVESINFESEIESLEKA